MSAPDQSNRSARRPDITYLITGLGRGGAEIGMVRLLTELDDRGYDITVVSLRATPDEVSGELPDDIGVHRLGFESRPGVGAVRAALHAFRTADVVVCSLFHAVLAGAVLGVALRRPSVLLWQHSTEYFGVGRRRVARWCYAVADGVLADSAAVAAMLHEMGVPGEKTHVLPIAGIDTDRFTVATGRGEGVDVGTVGRLVPAKGYDTLLACAARLNPEVTVHVIGDGPLREELESRAAELDGATVEFHGGLYGADFVEALSSLDVYCQPSRAEGLCMTAIEAMACGLPVVASDVGGLSESVIDGETGYLVTPDDVDAFVERIEGLLDDPERRQEFGRRGRERVLERYSQAAFADAFEEVLCQVGVLRPGGA
jgi:glycosyltransferase involved in cell wall biosynthesis